MKLRDTRFWAVLVAIAFLVLWCASIGVTYAAPTQEPLPEPIQAAPAPEIQAIGIWGWAIVGIGSLGVVFTVVVSCKAPKKRRRAVRAASISKTPYKVMRSVYSPPPTRRYHRNIERRR